MCLCVFSINSPRTHVAVRPRTSDAPLPLTAPLPLLHFCAKHTALTPFTGEMRPQPCVGSMADANIVCEPIHTASAAVFRTLVLSDPAIRLRIRSIMLRRVCATGTHASLLAPPQRTPLTLLAWLGTVIQACACLLHVYTWSEAQCQPLPSMLPNPFLLPAGVTLCLTGYAALCCNNAMLVNYATLLTASHSA